MRTWAEQKAIEEAILIASRTAWLEDVCASGLNGYQIAEAICYDTSNFWKLCKRYGVCVIGMQNRILSPEYMAGAVLRNLTVKAVIAQTGLTHQAVYSAAARECLIVRSGAFLKRPAKLTRKQKSKLTPFERSALETSCATKQRWA